MVSERIPGLQLIKEDVGRIVGAVGDAVDRFSGRTVLITGARGFLASYMVDTLAFLNDQSLLQRPVRILAMIRPPTGRDDRLAHLMGRDDVQFLEQDARQPLQFNGPLHFIVHAASAAAPKSYLKDPVGTMQTNTAALQQLLELARDRNAESLLFFSSSEVYGTPDPASIPTPENYLGRVDFTSRRACYVESKRFGETLCRGYFEQYGVPAKSVRPFHVHGPGLRLDDGRIVAELISQGLANRPIELLSDGRATRTYGYVSDATVGFFKVLLSSCNGDAFNVGADSPETSILELAQTISRLFGRQESIRVNTATKPAHLQDAPDRACPDLTKIRRLLNYRPQVGLAEGLERTITWHKRRLEQTD